MGSDPWVIGGTCGSNIQCDVEEPIDADWLMEEHEAMGLGSGGPLYELFVEGFRTFCMKTVNMYGQPCSRRHLDKDAWEMMDAARRVDIAEAKRKEADEESNSSN